VLGRGAYERWNLESIALTGRSKSLPNNGLGGRLSEHRCAQLGPGQIHPGLKILCPSLEQPEGPLWQREQMIILGSRPQMANVDDNSVYLSMQ
jgi:hypothetical protein